MTESTAVSTEETVPVESDRKRWAALVVLCTGMLMIILDATIVNVALPSIQDDLHFSQSNLAWVVNAYLIPFGGLLLLAGRLGDLIGRRRLFISGLTLFTVASLLCGLADSETTLIAARFLQGIGGAMTSAVILGMIIAMFPEPIERAKAIGVYSFVASAGASIGLLLGGVLTQAISWHWIFFVNIPIGIVTAILARRMLKHEDGIGIDKGADVPGAVLVTSAVMLGVYTIVQAADNGWGSGRTLLLGAVSIALLGLFVLREATAKEPLMPLGILRNRNVAGANLIQVLMIAGMFGMFFLGALYLQRVLGFTAIEVGVGFLPVSVAIGVLSLQFSPRLVMRYGPRKVMIPALALVAAGLALFSQISVGGSYVPDVLPGLILLGTGAGLAFPAIVTLAMSSASPEDAGLASGLVNTTQQVGGALGLALLSTLAATKTDTLTANGDSVASALTGGYQLAFTVAAGLVVFALVLAVTVLKPAPAGAPVDEMAIDEVPTPVHV
jgi:EmrB/QacA subfamily drug resistance transporter